MEVGFNSLDVLRNSPALGNRKNSREHTEQQLARFCDSHGDGKPKTELSKRGKINIWNYNDKFQMNIWSYDEKFLKGFYTEYLVLL